LIIYGFIPARAGSKGVPRKNVRLLGGKPLITYTIETALAVPEISRIVVTTNCKEVKSVASNYPIAIVDRPNTLALDETPTFPVIEHALDEAIAKFRVEPDVVLLLQCTSPLRRAQHIREVIRLFEDQEISSVISVIEVGDEHPARMYKIAATKQLLPFDNALVQMRRQDLPKLYRRNGAIYAIRYRELLKQKTFIANGSVPYVMEPAESVNIDTELDLIVAEALLNIENREHD
jgi:CMP-N,N'-diacetyllegionaminic acid synthase